MCSESSVTENGLCTPRAFIGFCFCVLIWLHPLHATITLVLGVRGHEEFYFGSLSGQASHRRHFLVTLDPFWGHLGIDPSGSLLSR